MFKRGLLCGTIGAFIGVAAYEILYAVDLHYTLQGIYKEMGSFGATVPSRATAPTPIESRAEKRKRRTREGLAGYVSGR